ncbi:MAG: bifunctional hydroxymethylpyrimidine kinase/phosphomethylpyrimidine kinase [Armatimonadota bacterium]
MRDQHQTYPCALTIAGSDSGGGAGIQADLKTFAALGVYGASVITAITAQNTVGVRAIHDVPSPIIAAQIDAVLEDLPIRAIKIGMLSSIATIRTVTERLRAHQPPAIVLDTVMIAKSGDALLAPDALAALRDELVPMATIITPNLPEAACLLGLEAIGDRREAAQALLDLGARAVLLKGGHGEGEEIEDLLAAPGLLLPISHPRVHTANTHGTGCSLSSAVAAGLAKGLDLPAAVTAAISWLQGAILHARPLGAGHGPVHHFWNLWPRDEV